MDFSPSLDPITGYYIPCVNGIALSYGDLFKFRQDAIDVAKGVAQAWDSCVISD